jgi:hypothetical protein
MGYCAINGEQANLTKPEMLDEALQMVGKRGPAIRKEAKKPRPKAGYTRRPPK